MAKQKQLSIKLVGSYAGCKPSQRATLAALGLTKINQVVVKPDNDSIRGMVNTVSHLVEVLEGK